MYNTFFKGFLLHITSTNLGDKIQGIDDLLTQWPRNNSGLALKKPAGLNQVV